MSDGVVMVDSPLTCQTFPAYLERHFPDHLTKIRKVRGSNHPVTVTASILVGEVFVDCIYAAGVEGGDEEVLARWFDTVERALSGPDEVLRTFFQEDVEPIVLKTDRRARWTQELAGPRLRERLDAAVGVAWQHQLGGFGLEYDEQLPDEVLVAGYLYRDEILLHCRRRGRGRSSLPTTEPFARVPVHGEAIAVGVAVARLLEHLSTTVDENPRHQIDEFMAFAGVSDWVRFYSETLTVNLEGTADSFALSVWPIHKADQGGWLNSWPAKPLRVSNWRSAAELGAAVLTAFGMATVKGSSMPE